MVFQPAVSSPRNWLRIFLASSFEMRVERNLFVQDVIPSLRSRLAPARVSVEGVDLRWGVPSEFSLEDAADTCLEVLARTSRYFLCFLGENYGRGLVPTRLEDGWLGRLRELCRDQHELAALSRTYVVDGGDCRRIAQLAAADAATLGGLLRRAGHPRGGKSITQLEVECALAANSDLRTFFFVHEHAARNPLVAELVHSIEAAGRATSLQTYTGDDLARGAMRERVLATLWQHLSRDATVLPIAIPVLARRQAKSGRSLVQQHRDLAESIAGAATPMDEVDHVLTALARRRTRFVVLRGAAGSGRTTAVAAACREHRRREPDWLRIPCFSGAIPGSSEPGDTVRSWAEAIAPHAEGYRARHGHLRWVLGSAFDGPREVLTRALADVAMPLVCFLDGLDGAPEDLADLEWLPDPLPDNLRFVLSWGDDPNRSLPERLVRHGGETEVIPLVALNAAARSAFVVDYLASRGKRLDPDLVDRITACAEGGNRLFLRLFCDQLLQEVDYSRVAAMVTGNAPDRLEDLVRRAVDASGRDPYLPILQLLGATRTGLSEAELRDALASCGRTLPDDCWQRLQFGPLSSLLQFGGDRAILRNPVVRTTIGQMSGGVDAHRVLLAWLATAPTSETALREVCWQLAALLSGSAEAALLAVLERTLGDYAYLGARICAGQRHGLDADCGRVLDALRSHGSGSPALAAASERIAALRAVMPRVSNPEAFFLGRSPLPPSHLVAQAVIAGATGPLAAEAREVAAGNGWPVFAVEALEGPDQVGWNPLLCGPAIATAPGGWFLFGNDSSGCEVYDGPRHVATIPSRDGVTACALSQDGRLAAIGTSAGVVEVLELPSLRRRDRYRAHPRQVTGLGFAPDGGLLASCGLDDVRTVVVRDWRSRRSVRRFGCDLVATVVAFAGEDALVAAGSPLPGAAETLVGWSVAKGTRIDRATRQRMVPVSCAVAPDGRFVVTAGVADSLYWRLGSDPVVTPIRGVFAVAPSARRVGVGYEDGGASIRDLTSGDRVSCIGTRVSVRCVEFSADEATLFTADEGGHLNAWDTVSGDVVGHLSLGGPLRNMVRCGAGLVIVDSSVRWLRWQRPGADLPIDTPRRVWQARPGGGFWRRFLPVRGALSELPLATCRHCGAQAPVDPGAAVHACGCGGQTRLCWPQPLAEQL